MIEEKLSVTHTIKKLPKLKIECYPHGERHLNDYLGQWLVLYFYPRDDTPGCTQESNDFSAHYKKFTSNKCQVVGVSRDTMKSHEKFASKYELPFDLISDPDEKLCERFHVMKSKNMYGKQVRGIERSTFLFDPEGKLLEEWRKVKVTGHVEDVLNELMKLRKL